MAIYRVTTFGRDLAGERWNFTMHGSMVTAQAAIIAIRAADAITLMWDGIASPGDSIKQLYDNGTVVDGVRVDELNDLGRNVSQSVAPLALVGTGVDEPMPPQIAMVVSLRTVVPTRAGRGRFYLPAPTVGSLNSQLMASATRSSVLSAAGAMIEHMNGLSGYNTVIYHRADKTFTEVVTIDVGNVFDTQRRRRNKLIESRAIHTLL